MDSSQDPLPVRRRNVVVVEDDTTILALVTMCLEGEGIPVHGFRDPAEALRSSILDEAGLVLLDLTLPNMRGEEFVQALRARRDWIPVCVMTAADEAGERARSIDVECVLQKPFELEDLIEIVRRHVG